MNIEKIAVRARIGRKPRMVKTFDVIGFLKTFLWILFDIFSFLFDMTDNITMRHSTRWFYFNISVLSMQRKSHQFGGFL